MNLKLKTTVLLGLLITAPSLAQMTVEEVYKCVDKLEQTNLEKYNQFKIDAERAFSYLGTALTADEAEKMELTVAQKSNTCEEALANIDAKHKIIISGIEKIKSDLLK